MKKNLPAYSGAFVIIFFFLPWIMVSCGTSSDVGLELSGFELATGNYSDLEDASFVKSYPELFLIPIMGAIALRSLRGDRDGFKIALGSGILGMIGLMIFSLNLSKEGSDVSIQLFSFQYRIGYIGSWIAFAVQTISAAMPLIEVKDEEKEST